jgi:hypothetical protein
MRRLTRATLVVLITGMCAWPAYPAAIRCRSDPAVVLSDGTVLDLSADIDANLWDITSIEYTIHLPCKTKALLAVGTPNWPTTLEKFTIYSDSSTGVYDTQTVVRTRYTGTAVTANLLVLPLLKLFPSVASASGIQGQSVRVKVTTR